MNLISQHLEQILREGAHEKLFPGSRVPLYARMIHGAVKSVTLWRVSQDQPFEADADLIVDTFLHGVVP